MEIYYTDTSDPAVSNINPTNNRMHLLDDDELQYYEYGAHFKYKELVARLTTLLHSALQEAPITTFSPNKPAIQITKSRNTATTQAKLVDKDKHPHNNLYFRLNNGNINNNNNRCMCTNNKAKANEHLSTAIKQNKKPNQSNLAVSSLTVVDKISKLNNNANNRIKAKTNSNSNCSYQNINNNNNNKQSSPPSTVSNKFIKTNISSIKYQNTNNSSSSNKSNPNLILYPSSSKSKAQLKAISELLKSKISKGKNAVTNSNNISSYTSSNKSRNVTQTTNKTVHCILNHNNIHNNNNNGGNSSSNCFGLQYAQTKPHSVDRKISNNTSRKITAYHAKPKGSSGYTANAHVHAHAHAQNTILVSTLNSHNNNNNTTQSSQYNMDLSLTSSMKHNNDGYAVSRSKQIKQKLISVAKNSDNGVNHCCSSSSSSKTKSASQQKQKITSRNIRNSSVIKNTINRTQHSHGCANNINTANCQCKKGNSNNSGNCYSNTINSHSSSKKKLFTNSTTVNHAISTMMNELKARQQLKK